MAMMSRCAECGRAYVDTDDDDARPVCVECSLEIIAHACRDDLHAAGVAMSAASAAPPAAWHTARAPR